MGRPGGWRERRRKVVEVRECVQAAVKEKEREKKEGGERCKVRKDSFCDDKGRFKLDYGLCVCCEGRYMIVYLFTFIYSATRMHSRMAKQRYIYLKSGCGSQVGGLRAS
jgi:hypothetical protein